MKWRCHSVHTRILAGLFKCCKVGGVFKQHRSVFLGLTASGTSRVQSHCCKPKSISGWMLIQSSGNLLNRLLSRNCRAGLIRSIPIPGAVTIRGELHRLYMITEQGRLAWEARRDMIERIVGPLEVAAA